MNKKDITHKKFGNLFVESSYWDYEREETLCHCICDCGTKKLVYRWNLVSGHTKSCGCLLTLCLLNRNLSHGMRQTRFYGIWCNMKSRCLNPNNDAYYNYGGRGITVWDRWLQFENFRDDMYESYLEHVKEFGEVATFIDRKDNDLLVDSYSKANCRWATREEQQNNTRLSSKTSNHQLHIRWRKKLTTIVSETLRGKIKNSCYFKIYIGCTPEEFKKHIQSLWEPWMNWDNYGSGIGKWNIDHIVSCNQFDLTIEKQRMECWNFKNLRPYDSIKNNREKIRIRF
jgi:hypothetical protein